MYPQGPRLYTQSFLELAGEEEVEVENLGGGVNSFKTARYFLKYVAVLEELGPPHKISSSPTGARFPVYKREDLQGTTWKMRILNIRSLASLVTIIVINFKFPYFPQS